MPPPGWSERGVQSPLHDDLLFSPSPCGCPTPFGILNGMMKPLAHLQDEPGYWNLIASFGHARLYHRADGRVELRGGSEADRTDAKEWISLFMHEVVPRIVISI
jgi:hypothetical protein